MSRSSYSSITLDERCGAAWHYRYKEKRPSAVGVAAQRGKRLHAAAERFIKGEIPEQQLPVEFWRLKEWIVMLKAAGAQTEMVITLDANWQRVPSDGNEAWIVIIDLVHIDGDKAFIYDLKSGKPYDSHADQLQLYAAVILSVFPELESVEVAAVYLDSGQQLYQARYIRELLPDLIIRWNGRRLHELSSEKKPNPSFAACRFCSYAASRGGPCENEFVPTSTEGA